MDENLGDGERVGDQAGVLPAGAAKAAEHVLGHIEAALDADLLDGVRHVVDSNPQEAVGDLLRRHAGLLRELGELQPHDLVVQPLVGVRAEDSGEVRRLQLAEHDVAVGHGDRASPPVARRPGVGARALRPDGEPRPVVAADGGAACRHGVDVHHGRAHPHPRHLRLKGPLKLAGVVRGVGRGSAHVEADDLVVPSVGGGARHADDAASRAGDDAVLALEEPRVGQATTGLHEHEPRAAEL